MQVEIRGIESLENFARHFPKVAARGLNKTMLHVRTQMVKDVRGRYNITSKELKELKPISKAQVRKLQASYKVKGTRFQLVKFVTQAMIARSMKQAGKRISRRPLVKAKFSRGTSTPYPHAFAQQMPTNPGSDPGTGHIGIFWRKKSGKIKQITAASLPQMFSGVWERLLKVTDVRKRLEETLIHELEWELFGKKGKGGGGDSSAG